MSGLVTQLQKHGHLFTVTEFVTGKRQTRRKLLWFPHYRERILHVFFFSVREYALGAGDRQFESGHPEFFSFLRKDLYKLPANYRVESPLKCAQSVNC